MLACTMTLASEMTEFCTPDGSPCAMTARSVGASNRTCRQRTAYAPVALPSLRKARAALKICERMVAKAAEPTPMWKPATNKRSSTTLSTDAAIR